MQKHCRITEHLNWKSVGNIYAILNQRKVWPQVSDPGSATLSWIIASGLIFSHLQNGGNNTQCIRLIEQEHKEYTQPSTTGHILCDPFFMTCPELAGPGKQRRLVAARRQLCCRFNLRADWSWLGALLQSHPPALLHSGAPDPLPSFWNSLPFTSVIFSSWWLCCVSTIIIALVSYGSSFCHKSGSWIWSFFLFSF